MTTGSESNEATAGPTKDPASSRDAPSEDAPVEDSGTSEAKVAPTSSPAKNLALAEGKAHAQAAKAASSKRADECAAAAKKRAALGSPTLEPPIAKGYRSFSDSESKEGAITKPQEISSDLDEQQERYQAAQLQRATEVLSSVPPTPVYPRGYYPPDAGTGSLMFLEHLVDLTMGSLLVAPLSDEPLFVNDIEAARCVLLAPHRIPLKEFTSLRKKPEDRVGLFPVWGYPWNFTVQELKELREARLLSYVLDQQDLRIEFAHLIAKRQLHSVMEGLRQQSKSSAQDDRGYGSVNPGTVHRKAAKKPRTTYRPGCYPRSQQPSGSQPGACLPAPMCSVTRGNPATSQAAGASQSAAALGRPAPHGSGARRSDQGGQEEPSRVFNYEAPSQYHAPGPFTSGRDCVRSLLREEVRRPRDWMYAIKIALGLGPNR
ncbi:LOW QUALITY PROTEIN: ATP-binding cassette (ABC) Superfamily [Phytophthora palmivora]|uniref:ATP-binding cassette (ABC) Superfamily n=1 Tax=Phytophthora palmivora TaxID=4796 RepID=A0A2P4XAE2_9STRA|nr:LOW QUALITY PROTEIN: ATP-binding cassette (ABC) Superfamily [Phytophthora palmivora]